MHSYDNQDGWFVTTPAYVGDEAAVRKATQCQHDFQAGPDPVRNEDGQEFYIERCTKCVAVRGKHRTIPAKDPEA